MRYQIDTDTGLSGTFQRDYDMTKADQATLRRAMEDYGDWIYGAGGQPVQWEYQNHWLPKLRMATVFTATRLAEKVS